MERTIDVFTLDGAPAGTIAVTALGPRTLFEYTGGESASVTRLSLISGGEARSLGIPAPEGGRLRLKRTLTRLELGGFDLSSARGVLTEPGANLASVAARSAPEEAVTEEVSPEAEAVLEEVIPEAEAVSEEAIPEAETVPEAETDAEAGSGPSPVPAAEEGWYLEPDPARHFADPALREAAARAGEAWVRFEGPDTLLAFPWTPSGPFPMIPVFRFGTAASMAGREFMLFRLRDGAVI